MNTLPSTWYGPTRIRTFPENQEKAAAPHLHRGRVLLGLLGGAPRKVEVQDDGTVVTVMDRFKGEKLIHVTLPLAEVEPGLHWGTWLTPTAEDAPDGYTGEDPVTPTTPRILTAAQDDAAAFHSLSFYDDAITRRPTGDIRRYRGFNADIQIFETREFIGSSDNGQGISWDNAPTRHNQHLAIFGNLSIPRGGGRQFDLGHIIAWRAEVETAATYKKLAGTSYDPSPPLFSMFPNATHWNCIFYKGKMINLPDAYFQMSFAPIQVEYLERTVYNVRIGGCFYRDGKLCYIRSAPFYSPQSAPVERLDAEEFVFSDASITEHALLVSDQERIAAGITIPIGDPNWDKFTWSDWVFNNDGSEAICLKVIQEGASKNGGYFRVQIDWEAEVITGSFINEANLLKMDWGMDGTLLKLIGVNDNAPVNPKFTFTLPTGQVVVAQGVNFFDLRHDTYIFGDYDYDGGADTSTIVFRLVSRGTTTVIYDETRSGNPGTDIYGNLINPALITEDGDDFTVVAISCQMSPGNGWPEKVYNNNFDLLGEANMLGKNAPALNPILRG